MRPAAANAARAWNGLPLPRVEQSLRNSQDGQRVLATGHGMHRAVIKVRYRHIRIDVGGELPGGKRLAVGRSGRQRSWRTPALSLAGTMPKIHYRSGMCSRVRELTVWAASSSHGNRKNVLWYLNTIFNVIFCSVHIDVKFGCAFWRRCACAWGSIDQPTDGHGSGDRRRHIASPVNS